MRDKYEFVPIHLFEFNQDETPVSEHKQVSDKLKDVNKNPESQQLKDLKRLRKKGDYEPFNPLTDKEVKTSLSITKYILKNLTFD